VPFPDRTVSGTVARHAHEAPRPLSDFTPEVTPALQQVVNWMLAKEPAQRYQTPERAAHALQATQAGLTDLAARADSGAPLPEYQTWLEAAGPMSVVPDPGPGPPATPTPAIPVGKLVDVSPALRSPRDPEPAPAPERAAPASAARPARSLLEPDRRDFFMLGTGVVGTLAAIAIGWLLSRLVARREHNPDGP
jgi:hypothetical protein